MAEFQVVMRQYARLCRTMNTCTDCPVANLGVYLSCRMRMMYDPDSAERIILNWAAEHPEPRYPTWQKWWRETFPDAEERAVMCNFARCPRPDDPEYCQECMNSPIPADIAKKLGIEHITEEE